MVAGERSGVVEKHLSRWPVLLTNALGGWGEQWCSGEVPCNVASVANQCSWWLGRAVVKCLAMWPVLLTNAHGGWGEQW
jgi:hypothetical protein